MTSDGLKTLPWAGFFTLARCLRIGFYVVRNKTTTIPCLIFADVALKADQATSAKIKHGMVVNLGLMYEKGCGVAKDEGMAVGLYRKSAEQGNRDAQENLKRLGR